MKISLPRWDGVAGCDADPKRDWRHFSSVDGDSVGDENEVDDAEDVRLEFSSAPEDVTSWRGLERLSDVGVCWVSPDRP